MSIEEGLKMIKKIWCWLSLSFLFALPAQGQDLEKEVVEWYKSYAAHWLEAGIEEEKVANYYASPFYYLSATGPALDDKDSMVKALADYEKAWLDQGWTGSRLLSVKVKVLNDSSAMIMTEWDIHNARGDSIIGCSNAPWTYMAAKTKEGWKLALEVEIACGQGLSITP